jgi:hypothetical protein
MTNNDCIEIFATCTLQLEFTPVNDVPNALEGGRIFIKIPPQIVINTPTCTATISTIDASEVSCLVDGN